MATQTVKTVVIDNFKGSITPETIGKLNSGLQPIQALPYGKNPVGNQFKNKGFQFIEQTVVLSQSGAFTTLSDAVVQTVKAYISPNPMIGAVDLSGNIYKINVSNPATPTPDIDGVLAFTGTAGATLHYGGGIYYDENQQFLVIGHDNGYCVSSSNPFANLSTATFTQGTGSFTASQPRPMAKFLGTLYVADKNHLLAMNNTYASVGSDVLNPSIPSEYTIRNLQVSDDGRYLIITASRTISTNAFDISSGQQPIYSPIDSVVILWNGTDATYSSIQFFQGLNITAIKSSATDTIMFGKDIDGVGIFGVDGSRLATIPDVQSGSFSSASSTVSYPPRPFQVDAIAKQFFFQIQLGYYIYHFMFDANTRELYPIYQDITPSIKGSVLGALCISALHAESIVSNDWKEGSRAKYYYFFKDLVTGTATGKRIHLQNYGGTAAGLYHTQVEEFWKKIRVVGMRIYCLPTASGQSFNAYIKDAGLNNIVQKSYTYAAGTDATQAQGAMSMIRFTVNGGKPISGMAFAFSQQTGTTPFIEKVEIDYLEVENPQTS